MVVSTADLFRADVESPDSLFDPTSIRLSQVGSCVRAHSLRATGHAGSGYTDGDLETFKAGHLLADVVAARWEKEFPGQVLREVVVDTGIEGVDVGHVDLYVVPLNKMIEVKSVKDTSVRFLPHPGYLSQLHGYWHFWGRKTGAVEVTHAGGVTTIDKPGPSTMELCYVPKGKILPVICFDVEPPDDEEVATVEEHLRVVVEAKRTGAVPPIPEGMFENTFPCNWGKAKCQYYHWCWK